MSTHRSTPVESEILALWNGIAMLAIDLEALLLPTNQQATGGFSICCISSTSSTIILRGVVLVKFYKIMNAADFTQKLCDYCQTLNFIDKFYVFL